MNSADFQGNGPLPMRTEAASARPAWIGPALFPGKKSIWQGPASWQYRFVKRGMDIVLSGIAICLFLSWLLPLLCLLVLIDLGAPVFFVQVRIGRHGRRFRCFKLRTMKMGVGPKEERLTSLSRHLRYHKLDELPQFLNVLKGEMSIVGPRPHCLSDDAVFTELIGAPYHLRHNVLPGITGLAQVNGYEGPVNSRHKLKGRIQLDLLYIRRWSLGLELRIMLQTVQLMLGIRF